MAPLSNIVASQNRAAGIHHESGGGGTSIVRIDRAVTNGNTAEPDVDIGPDDPEYGHGIEILGSISTSAPFSTFSDIITSANRGYGLFVQSGTVNVTDVKGGANGNGLTGGGAAFDNLPEREAG